MKTTIYIEGGGDTKQLHGALRQGFKSLFESAGFGGKLPKVVASGSRNEAFADFKIAFNKKKTDEVILLLVDSEDVVETSLKWTHLKNRDGWEKPQASTEDNVFLMVVCMESWFLADKAGLKTFFGSKFGTTKLPKNSDLEIINKTELYDGLKKATEITTKGKYGKGQHSFKILTCLNGNKVANHGKYSKEFFEYLESVL